jgi:hypothetical protein
VPCHRRRHLHAGSAHVATLQSLSIYPSPHLSGKAPHSSRKISAQGAPRLCKVVGATERDESGASRPLLLTLCISRLPGLHHWMRIFGSSEVTATGLQWKQPEVGDTAVHNGGPYDRGDRTCTDDCRRGIDAHFCSKAVL